ncbi:RING-H2 finger protein ATL64-like, partial [Miscanthus floridulus]|uniref:RING-H2 finger protein ATL64-like n=1 Tax=Miscanthus floridulus TaxID=154761 RepID=UPI0034597294
MAIVGAVTIATCDGRAVLSLASSESSASDEARSSGATTAAGAGSPLPAAPSDECAVRALPACGHTFHAECIGRWLPLRPECLLCRRPVPLTVADAGGQQPATATAAPAWAWPATTTGG